MNMDIVCVGKIKEKYIADGINEYKKRLESEFKIDVKELKDESAKNMQSENDLKILLKKEAERICEKTDDSSFKIALAIDGRELDSVRFSKLLYDKYSEGFNKITFIIGGSYGLDESVIEKSDFKLSFGKMTFPHKLMRLILMEQIYRAFTIKNGTPYHK